MREVFQTIHPLFLALILDTCFSVFFHQKPFIIGQTLARPQTFRHLKNRQFRMHSNRFYLSTAINYTNGPPHIGHAYEAIVGDVLCRYHRVNGKEVFFLTGTDEHGQKVAESAERESMILIDT